MVHEAFVRLCVAQRKEHVRNPAAFLTDVVGKVRIERWRSAQRLRRLFVDESVEEADAVDPSPGPEEWLQAEQRLDWLWQRLGAMSRRERDVFFLQRLGGLTCPEIAARLGISVSAVEKHIARAVAAMQDERRRASCVAEINTQSDTQGVMKLTPSGKFAEEIFSEINGRGDRI